MSDVKFIMAQVFMAGLYPSGLLCADVANKEAVSAGMDVVGEEWLVPYTDNGIFDHYVTMIQIAAPTVDSVRTVRLRDSRTGNTIWILGTLADWVDRVNACCGSTPSMPDVAVPSVIAEDAPCALIVCNTSTLPYFFVDVAPTLLAGQKLLLSGSCNGVAFTPAAPGAGFASIAAALSWAQGNWSTYGTFALSTDGDGIELRSGTCARGSFGIAVLTTTAAPTTTVAPTTAAPTTTAP